MGFGFVVFGFPKRLGWPDLYVAVVPFLELVPFFGGCQRETTRTPWPFLGDTVAIRRLNDRPTATSQACGRGAGFAAAGRGGGARDVDGRKGAKRAKPGGFKSSLKQGGADKKKKKKKKKKNNKKTPWFSEFTWRWSSSKNWGVLARPNMKQGSGVLVLFFLSLGTLFVGLGSVKPKGQPPFWGPYLDAQPK